MRPYTPDDAIKAAHITGCYPGAHGGPIHWGDPKKLGIEDLDEAEWGNTVDVHEGEVPCFWACGVTPQTAIQEARLPLAVTHAPGHMFVCDVTDDELFVATDPDYSFGR